MNASRRRQRGCDTSGFRILLIAYVHMYTARASNQDARPDKFLRHGVGDFAPTYRMYRRRSRRCEMKKGRTLRESQNSCSIITRRDTLRDRWMLARPTKNWMVRPQTSNAQRGQPRELLSAATADARKARPTDHTFLCTPLSLVTTMQSEKTPPPLTVQVHVHACPWVFTPDRANRRLFHKTHLSHPCLKCLLVKSPLPRPPSIPHLRMHT